MAVPWRVEDVGLVALRYLHYGQKIWLCVAPRFHDVAVAAIGEAVGVGEGGTCS